MIDRTPLILTSRQTVEELIPDSDASLKKLSHDLGRISLMYLHRFSESQALECQALHHIKSSAPMDLWLRGILTEQHVDGRPTAT